MTATGETGAESMGRQGDGARRGRRPRAPPCARPCPQARAAPRSGLAPWRAGRSRETAEAARVVLGHGGAVVGVALSAHEGRLPPPRVAKPRDVKLRPGGWALRSVSSPLGSGPLHLHTFSLLARHQARAGRRHGTASGGRAGARTRAHVALRLIIVIVIIFIIIVIFIHSARADLALRLGGVAGVGARRGGCRTCPHKTHRRHLPPSAPRRARVVTAPRGPRAGRGRARFIWTERAQSLCATPRRRLPLSCPRCRCAGGQCAGGQRRGEALEARRGCMLRWGRVRCPAARDPAAIRARPPRPGAPPRLHHAARPPCLSALHRQSGEERAAQPRA